MRGNFEGSDCAKKRSAWASRILAGAQAFTQDARTDEKARLKQAKTPSGGRRNMKHPGIIAVMGLNRA